MLRLLQAQRYSSTAAFRSSLNAQRRQASTATSALAADATSLKKPLFDKILIANRGEIACRIMRTCRRLGIRTVAVYSDMDKNAMHTQLADEAYPIGPAPSQDSYLQMHKILQVAKKSGAQAIHPGYGFLSENPDFCELVFKQGLEFIGPPASAIRAMGSKSASKNIMSKAKVPVVPGYHGENQDPEHLKQQAAKIGYPVLIKAIKGGGGKGMRIVESDQDFHVMLESSKREAKKSFGDDRVLVEKYLVTPRHVEVQVFADKAGNAVYLFERDCSVQRRHQKIIEEAPAPGLSEELRRSLGEKAVAAAKAVNYVGAGTVEFILDNATNQYYFMEMNTRLQVEHPVTEMVTGTDLVEWQLEVASGNRLPKLQQDLKLTGHAFEARIYAENPRNNFLPDTGHLYHLHAPAPSEHIRVETGVRQGDQVSVYYDPMIAKLVVHGDDRTSALRRLRKALGEYQVVGPTTNIEFLKTLASHPGFIAADVETGFIKKHYEDLFPVPTVSAESLAHLALGQVLRERLSSGRGPWESLSGSRLNTVYSRTLHFALTQKTPDDEAQKVSVKVQYRNGTFDVTVTNGETTTELERLVAHAKPNGPHSLHVEMELPSRLYSGTIVHEGDSLHLFEQDGTVVTVEQANPLRDLAHDDRGTGGARSVVTPMPCKISQVLVKPGAKVTKGTPLVILEAMKMEHVVRAPGDGVVERVLYEAGTMVEEGKAVVVFQHHEENGEQK